MERTYPDKIKASVTIPLMFLFALVKFLKPIYENMKGKEHISCPDPFTSPTYKNLSGLPDEMLNFITKQVQMLKTHTMNFGDFHQNFIGSLPGMKNLGKGHKSKLDVMNEKKRIIAELKNNENTMNSDSRTSVYNKLMKAIDDGWNAYLAIINGSVENMILPNGIRQISGRDFYAMITGIPSFYDDLAFTIDWLTANYKTYGELLEACSISEDELNDVIDSNTDLTELKADQLREILKSLKLKKSGNKAELIKRIKENRGETSSTASPSPQPT